MPEMIPVGNTGIPPNPQQTLQSLSGILGLQQQQQGVALQKQALQTGQYTQQSALANSQQDQQKNKELQAAQTLALQGAKSGKYTSPDGTLNRQKMADDISTVAPTYGQPVAGQLLSQANEVVQNQQAHQNLSATQQQQMGNTFLGLAGKQDVSNSDVIDAFGNLRANNHDPQFNRMLDSMLTHLPPNATPQQLQNLMAGWGAASTGQSQVEPGTVSTGAAILPTTSNRFTGTTQIGGTAGPGVKAQLSPSQQVPYIAQAAAAGSGASARATGVASSDVDRANEVANVQQQSSAAIPLTQRIDSLSHEIASGHLAKMISESGNYLGFSSINAARSQLNKDLGQVKGLAVSKAGSDSRAATILEGYPTDTTPEDTTHAAMDYIRGTARQNLARGGALSTAQAANPQLNGFQAADNNLGRETNPLMYEYQSLKTPQAQAAFLKRNHSSRDEAKAFIDQTQAAKTKYPNVLP